MWCLSPRDVHVKGERNQTKQAEIVLGRVCSKRFTNCELQSYHVIRLQDLYDFACFPGELNKTRIQQGLNSYENEGLVEGCIQKTFILIQCSNV